MDKNFKIGQNISIRQKINIGQKNKIVQTFKIVQKNHGLFIFLTTDFPKKNHKMFKISGKKISSDFYDFFGEIIFRNQKF